MIKFRENDTVYPNPNDFGNWRACPGIPELPEWSAVYADVQKDRMIYSNRLKYCSKTDLAWII